MKSLKSLIKKWHIFVKLIPILTAIFVLKLAFHKFGLGNYISKCTVYKPYWSKHFLDWILNFWSNFRL